MLVNQFWSLVGNEIFTTVGDNVFEDFPVGLLNAGSQTKATALGEVSSYTKS